MKTNNGYDINENQRIDIVARQFIFKNQTQWIVVARWKKKIRICLWNFKNQHAFSIFLNKVEHWIKEGKVHMPFLIR